MRKTKKLVSVLAVATLALTSLTACSRTIDSDEFAKNFEDKAFGGQGIDIEKANLNIKGEYKIVMSYEGNDGTMDLDEHRTFDYDINGLTAHGTTSAEGHVSYDIEGESNEIDLDAETELYLVEGEDFPEIYVKTGYFETLESIIGDTLSSEEKKQLDELMSLVGSEEWLAIRVPDELASEISDRGVDKNISLVIDEVNDGLTDFSVELLSNSKVTKKAFGGYKVTLTGEAAYEAIAAVADNYNQELPSIDDLLDEAGPGYEDALDDLLHNLTINLEFDKKYNLTRIEIPEFTTSIDTDEGSGSITFSCDIKLSKFGKIDEITVPGDVEDSSVNIVEEFMSYYSNALNRYDDEDYDYSYDDEEYDY